MSFSTQSYVIGQSVAYHLVIGIKMNRIVLLISLLNASFNTYSDGMCSFTIQEEEFFGFSESYPFSDKDYSPAKVAESKQRLADHEAGKEVPYYIHENTINLIHGGKLQAAMLSAKAEFEKYTPNKDKKWDRKEYDLKLTYLSARKAYCDFRRTHYAIDW